MRNKATRFALAALVAATASTAPALAGGALEQVDITGNVPSPVPGRINGKLVRIFWDARCIPLKYQMNNTQDPIPNPLGAPVITLADASAAFTRAFNSWNNIKTSYINMQIQGTNGNLGVRGFDMKNELTFRTAAGFTAIASSPSTSLIEDSVFTAGDDIDGDGDSDVTAGISVCTDTDGDGDFEFPPGNYKAGTIVDNDVQFNTKTTNGLRFTVADVAADNVARSVDLECVAVHEFGHSLGLSHTLDNQFSGTDGTGTTMFPFIDTGDPAAELSARSLGTDDIAWASYYYPEGSASSGPAALQSGDIPFKLVYGLIKGKVTHGVLNQPISGASVSATNMLTGKFEASGYSGTTQVAFDPVTGALGLVDPAYNILNGDYTIPVPLGIWKVGIEAMDGAPVAAGNVSLSGQIGQIFGQLNFNEEFWDGPLEDAVELSPGFALPVVTVPSLNTSNINFVTNNQVAINNFGTRDFIGFTAAPANRIYAVRIPASQITAINPTGDYYIQAATFETVVVDNSVVPKFAEAMITTGTASGTTATIDLANPLVKETNFIGQDTDFAPLYVPLPPVLGKHVRKQISRGQLDSLFLVLKLPSTTPFPGVSAVPPVVGLDGGVAVNDVPIFGLSYISDDNGATFTQVGNFNFRFALLATPAP